ncbi:hypothetical protein F8M41_024262 [Gigaspora margarita]|uniref:Uncharacterized protein n=1 Tax=Gigaspora margarita TaxID=4874 RepID=A0A8H4ABZ2_GIGMA|nr:hypothetical protein F8M41_024262 [Gigaspora margarita]
MILYLKDDPKLHYDLKEIHSVFNKFVIEWEQDMNVLAKDNLEAWLVCHVWTFIINMALKILKEQELESQMKRKINLLLKNHNSSREILAGEVARTRDIHDKKFVIDDLSYCLGNKGTIYIMNRPRGVVSHLTKKANLEAPIYIEGLCNLILLIIIMLELKNAIQKIIKIIKKIENDELEARVFRRNYTGVRLLFTTTTPTSRSSFRKK